MGGSQFHRKPAHVVVDLTPMLPGGENGGAKWFVLALLEEWSKLGDSWYWTLLTTARNESELEGLCPQMRRLRVLDGEGRPIFIPRLTSLPGGGRADLLYAPFTAPFYAHPAVPTIATVYDLQFLIYPSFFTPEERQERATDFQSAVAVAERLVCISNYVRDHVLRTTSLDPRRVERVYISLPDRLEVPDRGCASEVAMELGLVPGRYLLYPANFWAHKNHPMLLTAAGLYFTARPESDLTFVCVGAGPPAERRNLMEAARRMGLDHRFRFPGFMSEPDLAALLVGARALIFPSLFEGFGIPVLEAMAAGVPVLVSKQASLPEVAGDAALLFDSRRPAEIADAIAILEDDPGRASELVARAQHQVRRFGNAATMAAAYLSIFEDVLATKNGFVRSVRWRAEAARCWVRRGLHSLKARDLRGLVR